MAYLNDMPATCRNRATNPEFPLALIDSIKGEFDKGLGGGIFDASYVLSKLDCLTKHVKWLEVQAEEEWQTQIEEVHSETGEPEIHAWDDESDLP